MHWYDRIISAHLAVTQAVSHAARMKSERYFVWQEDGSNDLEANGIHQERAVTGSTDLFTNVEFDPLYGFHLLQFSRLRELPHHTL